MQRTKAFPLVFNAKTMPYVLGIKILKTMRVELMDVRSQNNKPRIKIHTPMFVSDEKYELLNEFCIKI